MDIRGKVVMTQAIANLNTASPSILKALKCKECGTEYKLEARHVCELCFGPLEMKYDYSVLRQSVSRATIEAGPHSIWRYRQFLPVATEN